jgi:hypothetical protein
MKKNPLFVFSTALLFFYTSITIAQSTTILPNSVELPNVSTNPSCTVTDKGKQVYNTTSNAMFYCNGSTWIEMGENAFSLPYSASVANANPLLTLINPGSAGVIFAKSGAGPSIYNQNVATFYSEAEFKIGIIGASSNNVGILGHSVNGAGLSGTSTLGRALDLNIVNAANVSHAATITNAGLGSAIDINNSNSNNTLPTINIVSASYGGGFYADTPNGTAVVGITGSVSKAGVFGNNIRGQAVVGISSGGNGIGAVVGKGDVNNVEGSTSEGSTGYGVQGYTTGQGGIGVLGQAGRNGSINIAGRFENVYNQNNLDVLQITTNGGGTGIKVTSSAIAALTGAGIVVQKNYAYNGSYTNAEEADLEVRHPAMGSTGLTGLRIFNTNVNIGWTLYTDATGNLVFFNNNTFMGYISIADRQYHPNSSELMKKDIYEIPTVLSKVNQLSPKYYKYLDSNVETLGFLAQDVEKIFPELVGKGVMNNEYSLNYAGVGVIAIKAIQEQQNIINHQQTEINELKAQMAEIRTKLK